MLLLLRFFSTVEKSSASKRLEFWCLSLYITQVDFQTERKVKEGHRVNNNKHLLDVGMLQIF